MRRIQLIKHLPCGIPLAQLVTEWQVEARRLSRSAPERADTYQTCTEELLAAFADWLTREVTASEAAKLTGKSARHIRRMIAAGELTRLGGDGERLRVYVGELFCCRNVR